MTKKYIKTKSKIKPMMVTKHSKSKSKEKVNLSKFKEAFTMLSMLSHSRKNSDSDIDSSGEEDDNEGGRQSKFHKRSAMKVNLDGRQFSIDRIDQEKIKRSTLCSPAPFLPHFNDNSSKQVVPKMKKLNSMSHNAESVLDEFRRKSKINILPPVETTTKELYEINELNSESKESLKKQAIKQDKKESLKEAFSSQENSQSHRSIKDNRVVNEIKLMYKPPPKFKFSASKFDKYMGRRKDKTAMTKIR